MKKYKEFQQEDIGASDGASLTLVGGNKEKHYKSKISELNFVEDGAYSAYIVEGEAEIGRHYYLEYICERYLSIFDDYDHTADFYAEEIRVYRAGDYGCIIQLLSKEDLENEEERGC